MKNLDSASSQNNSRSPLVSIILPVYRGEKIAHKAIESVLAQDFLDWELIIINDCSPDDSEKVILEYQQENNNIVYLKNEPNLGLQKTLNKGIRASRGTYIARIDQDDIWSDASKLSKQVAFLQERSDYVLVGTNANIYNTEGTSLGAYHMPQSDSELRGKILSKNCFLHSSIVARKDAMEKAGLYGEGSNAFCIEDYELWLRMGTIGKFANMNFPGLSILIHTQSITAKNRVLQAQKILEVIPAYKKTYPNFISGYVTSACRLVFFRIIAILPFNLAPLVYRIQAAYK